MQSLKLLYARFRSESPKYWKKVIVKAAIIGTIATGIGHAPDGVFVPEIAKQIAQYLGFFAYGISVAAAATTKDPELAEKHSS